VKRKWIWFAIALAAPAVVGAWHLRARPAAEVGLGSGREVVRAARRDLDAVVKATGVVRPVVGAEVKVGSQASGVVERLHVREGDRVERGQLLAELDRRELLARRDQAAAVLESARASAAQAAREQARARRLAAAQVLAQSDLERAEGGAAVAEASVAEAAARLALSQVQLAQARITAPISGVVASVATEEGETVSATLAAPTFVTIVDLDRLELWAYVDETDIGRIALGQAASFGVDAYPDRTFEGTVTAIHPRAEIRDNVVDYVVVVRFAPPRDASLRPEMTAAVRIVLARRPDVLAVPRRAVRREGDRSFVLCSDAGRPVRRLVRTGARDETHVEIADGLREGDEVLVGEPAAAQ
jgi:macrolide-specific efflux system membrane fusion protein